MGVVTGHLGYTYLRLEPRTDSPWIKSDDVISFIVGEMFAVASSQRATFVSAAFTLAGVDVLTVFIESIFIRVSNNHWDVT